MSCEKAQNIGVDISQVASARTPPNSMQCVSSENDSSGAQNQERPPKHQKSGTTCVCSAIVDPQCGFHIPFAFPFVRPLNIQDFSEISLLWSYNPNLWPPTASWRFSCEFLLIVRIPRLPSDDVSSFWLCGFCIQLLQGFLLMLLQPLQQWRSSPYRAPFGILSSSR